MNEGDRQGFDIVINRSVYAEEVDSPVVSAVFGGRGRMTVGQLVEKRAMTVGLILHHLSDDTDFNWSGIMPVVSAAANSRGTNVFSRGVVCLRQGEFYGPSKIQPCIVWGQGHCWYGPRGHAHFSIPKARAEAIVQSYPDPIASLDAILETPEQETA